MSSKISEFILLQDGKAVCYASEYATVRERLREMYSKNATPTYYITQVVATVAKPKFPTINSIYEEVK